MESAIEEHLNQARIPARKTKRAQRVPGFEQAPDFFVPDEECMTKIGSVGPASRNASVWQAVFLILRVVW